jgi:hypothetical protein
VADDGGATGGCPELISPPNGNAGGSKTWLVINRVAFGEPATPESAA